MVTAKSLSEIRKNEEDILRVSGVAAIKQAAYERDRYVKVVFENGGGDLVIRPGHDWGNDGDAFRRATASIAEAHGFIWTGDMWEVDNPHSYHGIPAWKDLSFAEIGSEIRSWFHR